MAKLFRSKREGDALIDPMLATNQVDANTTNLQYMHLQVTCIGDQASILLLENMIFSHNPCSRMCEAGRSLETWTHLPLSCQSAVLKHLHVHKRSGYPVTWCLHAAWATYARKLRGPRYLRHSLHSIRAHRGLPSYILVFTCDAGAGESYESTGMLPLSEPEPIAPPQDLNIPSWEGSHPGLSGDSFAQSPQHLGKLSFGFVSNPQWTDEQNAYKS